MLLLTYRKCLHLRLINRATCARTVRALLVDLAIHDHCTRVMEPDLSTPVSALRSQLSRVKNAWAQCVVVLLRCLPRHRHARRPRIAEAEPALRTAVRGLVHSFRRKPKRDLIANVPGSCCGVFFENAMSQNQCFLCWVVVSVGALRNPDGPWLEFCSPGPKIACSLCVLCLFCGVLCKEQAKNKHRSALAPWPII